MDSQGNTLEFHLSATRDAQAAKRFFTKALGASHTMTPRVVTVDKNAAYPKALTEVKIAGFFQQRVNCDRTSISIIWLNKTIALSNNWRNQDWASFPLRRPGEHVGIAAAINVARLIDWLDGIGPVSTRASAFQRLVAGA